ncbi:MAG: DUF748 domain-containing protein [Bdellovibrionota bacterium]
MKKTLAFLRRHPFLIMFFAFLILFRASLPYIAKNSINWFLQNKLEHYTGEIADFDLSLWRGAYQVEGFVLKRKSAGDNPPFFTIQEVDLSLAWRAIFQGKFMGDLIVTKPTLRFVDSEKAEKKQYGQNTDDLGKAGSRIVPIALESVKIRDGEVYLRNDAIKKLPLVFEVVGIMVDAHNLTNVNKSDALLPSTLDASANMYSAPMTLKGAFNVTKKKPDADLDFQMENFKLPNANPLMMAYGPVTFNKGEFSLFTELAIKDGKLSGYLKPVFSDVDMVAIGEQFLGVKHFGLEVITGIANMFFRNSKTKDVVTKVQIGGTNLQNLNKRRFEVIC